MKFWHKTAVLGALAVLSLTSAAGSAQLPSISKPLTRTEVQEMYAGKTWTWKDIPTGIYFMPSGSLVAYEDRPNERVGQGKWTVDPRGRLCVNIRWQKTAGGHSRYRSCWSHRRVGTIIWKQHVARSEWYSLFGRSNEAGRIRSGNRLKGASQRSAASW